MHMKKDAMQMKLLRQRFFSRSLALPLLVGAILFLFVLTSSRIRHAPFAHDNDLLDSSGDDGDDDDSLLSKKPPRPAMGPGECAPEIEYLRQADIELSDNIIYSRRCVKPVFGNARRHAVTKVDDNLFLQRTAVDLSTCGYVDPIPCEELLLDVPYAYPDKKYSHLAFVIASNYKRTNQSLPSIAHWLAGTGAKFVGVVVDAEKNGTSHNLTALEEEYRAWNVDATFVPPRLKKRIGADDDSDDEIPVEHHHFMMLRDILDVSTSETEWIGILDDDTFFPSLYPLDEALAKMDSTKPWWAGALSEDFGQVKTWGYMAFGGAGSFLSMPLAREIEPWMEMCIAETSVDTGDGIMRDCIYAHSRTRLTLMDGLYQHDLTQDASGFYESGVRPITLHHWKSWYHEPITKMAAVSGLCGDCFLQRYQFAGNFLLANGYSITHYPGGMDTLDLNRIEGTWPHNEHSFDFSLGKLRPKLDKNQKKSWKLKDSEVLDDGSFRQIYVFKGDKELDEIDEVMEFLWKS